MSETKTLFKPTLSLVDATMVVAGSMIGSGIFIVSADITRNVGSAGWLIAVWAITGFMTITAAVSYGELSGMYPKAGGQYVFLKEAFKLGFGEHGVDDTEEDLFIFIFKLFKQLQIF